MPQPPDPAILDAVMALVLGHTGLARARPFVLGLCGAQGCGKSTLAGALAAALCARGLPAAVLSIHDIYKTRAERGAMARASHPLFQTRGPPGTHDIALAMAVLDALGAGLTAPLPRFDKACDDRAEAVHWGIAPAETRVLILEGWLVGARPPLAPETPEPLNALEAGEDADGRWRALTDKALRGDYQALFARIDALVLLAAGDFGDVPHWRAQQEAALRREGRGGMTDAAVARFIQYYERLTRRILAEMPAYADLVITLDAQRRARSIARPA